MFDETHRSSCRFLSFENSIAWRKRKNHSLSLSPFFLYDEKHVRTRIDDIDMHLKPQRKMMIVFVEKKTREKNANIHYHQTKTKTRNNNNNAARDDDDDDEDILFLSMSDTRTVIWAAVTRVNVTSPRTYPRCAFPPHIDSQRQRKRKFHQENVRQIRINTSDNLIKQWWRKACDSFFFSSSRSNHVLLSFRSLLVRWRPYDDVKSN